jgi:hypothetical protein
LDKWNSLHKNDKLGNKYEHENTLYYKKYQTTDLAFFLGSTKKIIVVQKLSHTCFTQILLSSKNNKNQPLKALELHIIIFLQIMHDTYFS